MLRRGYGLSVHVRFTADGELVTVGHEALTPPKGGAAAQIDSTKLADLRETTRAGHHIPVFTEILAVFRSFAKAKLSPHVFFVLHLQEGLEDHGQLDAFLVKAAWMYPPYTLIVAGEAAARYLHAKRPDLRLAFRVSAGASLDPAVLRKKCATYSFAWIAAETPQNQLAEWGADPAFGATVKAVREAGFSVAIACRGTEVSLGRVASLRPELLCTDAPEVAEAAVNAAITPLEGVFEQVRALRGALKVSRLRHRLSLAKNRLLSHLLNFVEVRSGFLITFHRRPLFSAGVTDTCDPLVKTPACAIVLQGGLLRTHDFTLETVRIYKKFYPGARIIVSTWEGEDAQYVERIRQEGVTVLQSKKPDYFGPFNINLQVLSAFRGIEEARRQGAAYVFKTRADQRMYNKNALETVCNLLEYFPPAPDAGQRRRLLFVHGGNKYQPFHLPDVFVCGAIEDMLDYWEPILIEKEASYALFLPEIHLASRYLKKKGVALEWTTQRMWQMQRDRFMALDWSDVELYWYKYDRYHEHMDRKSYTERVPVYDHLSFFEWFNIFHAQENKVLLPVHALFLREFPARYPTKTEL